MRGLPAAALSAAVLLAGLARADEGDLVADVPVPRFVVPPHPAAGPALARRLDLEAAFLSGDGQLGGPSGAGGALSLPWRAAPGRGELGGVVAWPGPGPDDSDSMRAIVLGTGQAWCSPEVDLPAGGRLRLEARGLSEGSRLELSWAAQGQAARPLAAEAAPGPGEPELSVDLALPAGRGSACLATRSGQVAFGVARVLAPEPPGDARPRLVVLVVNDAMRADILGSGDAPALDRLAAEGAVYLDALSPGAHTIAAVPALLSGRDLMRIDPAARLDPVSRHRSIASLEQVEARPNLFLPQLAEAGGYATLFVGNNVYLAQSPLFGRVVVRGSPLTGTVDSAQALGRQLARFPGERLLLVYYITATHTKAAVPRRLLAGRGCDGLAGVDLTRCHYGARVAHGDEGLGALVSGLEQMGLRQSALLAVTSDHGEAFHDGWQVEGQSWHWGPLDEAHGFSLSSRTLRVPLVLSGPGVPRLSNRDPVSTLDVVPTLAHLLRLPRVNAWDGTLLPGFGQAPARDRRRVSYAFNANADSEGGSQFVWWDLSRTPRRRVAGEPRDRTDAREIWVGDRVTSPPEAVLERRFERHARWIAERFPAPALVLDLQDLPEARITVGSPAGRIVDFGPIAAGSRLAGLADVALSADGRELSLRAAGYRGLLAVTPFPPSSALTVRCELPGGAAPAVLAGPWLLPYAALGTPLDPVLGGQALVARERPAPGAPALRPTLRLWWELPRMTRPDTQATLLDLDRVLRQWGYIR